MHYFSHLVVPVNERHFLQNVLLSESAERVDQKIRDLLRRWNAKLHDAVGDQCMFCESQMCHKQIDARASPPPPPPIPHNKSMHAPMPFVLHHQGA